MTVETITLLSASDLVEYYARQSGMVPGFRQLSRGEARFDYLSVDLGGVSLLWSRNNIHSIWRDSMRPNVGLQLGFVCEAEGEVVVQGEAVSRDHALVWIPGHEIEYIEKRGAVALEVWIDQNIVDHFGWVVSGDPLATVPNNRLVKLTAVARSATEQARSVPTISRQRKMAMRSGVLAVMDEVLRPWIEDEIDARTSASRQSRYYGIFRKAERLSDELGTEGIDMAALAEAAGVSRRSLFLAFERCVGVGPRRYLEIQRLNSLRDRLLAASPEDRTVTALASELEFTDFGRMAGRYYELFQEYPSETLRQSPKQPQAPMLRH